MDPDSLRGANLMIALHGARAETVARRRAEQLRRHGHPSTAEIWEDVTAAIDAIVRQQSHPSAHTALA